MGGVWLLRGGNGAILNTETKPPARVATEAYFSGIYACFRYVDLASCAVGFGAAACAYWLFLTRTTSASARSLTVLLGGVYAGFFALCGFLSTDPIERSAVLLRTAPTEPKQEECLSCSLVDEESVAAERADRFVNDDFRNPFIYEQYKEMRRLYGFERRYPCIMRLNRHTADPRSLVALDSVAGIGHDALYSPDYGASRVQDLEICVRMARRGSLRGAVQEWVAETRPTTTSNS